MADRRSGATPERRRPRRVRTVLEVLVVVAVLAGLFLGADALARTAAESLLVRTVSDAVGSDAEPQVEVRGGFFLPQVIRGAYQEVHVVTPAVSSGPLRVERVDSTLTDVRVPFHDVLLRDIRAVGIGRAEQTAVVTYDDLNHYFAVTGRRLAVAPAPGGRLRLSGRVDVLADSVDVTATADVSAANGQLVITATEVDTSAPLSTAARLLLAQRLRLSVPMGMLPFGQQLTSVTAGERSITVTAVGTAVVLDP